jgi:uncharacterized protein YciI
MATYALICTIDETKLDVFSRLRGDHYAFLIAERTRIHFGGPTRVSEGGRPETMIIIITADSQTDAETFLAREPYNAHGGFRHVAVRPWTQVIPELDAGELQATLDAERR